MLWHTLAIAGQESLSSGESVLLSREQPGPRKRWHPQATAPSLGMGFGPDSPSCSPHLTVSAQTGIDLRSAGEVVRWPMGKTAAALQRTGTGSHLAFRAD